MTALWTKCAVCYACFLVISLSPAGFEPCTAQGVTTDTLMAGKAARPWLMVSLTPRGTGSFRHVISVVKNLSGNPNVIVRHFGTVTPEFIHDLQPEFVVLSPQGTPWCRYTGGRGIDLQNFLWLLPMLAEDMNIPILGICGGHQALAIAFGGKVGPIRGGEYDCMPYTRDRQRGVVPLEVIAPDPIFRGIDGSLRIVESHYDEVKILPPGFVLLASEKQSPNQIIRHPTRPVYGIQGHPERFHSNRPDGGILIRNFLKIAGTYNTAVRGLSRPRVAPRLLSFERGTATSRGN
ncbi:MAG: gamma-glutamyl-gamma-aminobutyrate hydrolase family protein [Desulfomonilaceae bacterium]|nr:gamma-glutamyl-gamma-aminobutyrate hydrolase family protein [Desulfomonilaceae bacterium]